MTHIIESLTKYGPKGLMQTIAASFILHVLAIAIGLLLFNSSTKKVFFSPVYTVNLVETATRRSTKAMQAKAEPKTVTPIKRTAKKAAPAKKISPTKKISMAKGVTAVAATKTVSIDDALKMVAEKVKLQEDKNLVASRIEALKKKTEAESATVAQGIEDIRKAIGESARLETVAPTGTASTEEAGLTAHRSALTTANLDVKYPEYLVALRDRVQENWSYPEAYRRTDLKILVSLKIAKDGKLINAWVERGSGDVRFDSSLINAIKKAAPFKPLPEGFEGDWYETGLRFCPKCD